MEGKSRNISGDTKYFAEIGWKVRQPEIDALKAKIALLEGQMDDCGDLPRKAKCTD